MVNRFSRSLLAAAVLSIAVALTAQEASNPASEGTEPDDLARQKLEAIQQEINVLRKQAMRLSEQENSVLAVLSQYDVEYQVKTHEIELLELREQKTLADIRSLQDQHDQLQTNLQKQKEYLTRRLVEAYKLGELNYLKLMLRASQSSDLIRSYQYITYLAKDDRRKVQNYRDSITELEQTRLRLEQENRNLVLLKADLQLAHDALQRSRHEKLRLLTSIRDEKSMHLTAMSDLRVAATRLDQFFTGVEPQQIAPAIQSGISISSQKGTLDWPVPGKITRGFGVYRHSRFGTTTMCNGVEIAAPEGTDVRAIFNGVVVFSEWFKGYGQSVILSHSDGYYTLYAHNSEILVQRGQTAQRGQVISKVGSTGSLEGSVSLYFEIRKRDQPLNPMEWLRRTRK